MYHALATLLDKTWQCLGAGRTVVDDAIEVAAIIRGVDRDALVREPSAHDDHQHELPAPPRRPDVRRADRDGEAGQPVVATPFTLAGAMTPVDARRRARPAERRGAVHASRSRSSSGPGAPMVYGGFTSNVDMRTGLAGVRHAGVGQGGARDRASWRAATGCRGGSSNATASNVVDAQAAYESEMAVWGAVMGGVNLLYQGAGWLEGGLTASFEKLIVDAEILQMIAEVLAPIDVDEATLGRRRHRARSAPGGHFFAAPHTLERYETAFYRPLAVRLAELRDVAGGRGADGHRAREPDLEAAPRGVRRRRRWTRASARRSTRSSAGASARSPAGREGTRSGPYASPRVHLMHVSTKQDRSARP